MTLVSLLSRYRGFLHTAYNSYDDTARASKIKEVIMRCQPLADIITYIEVTGRGGTRVPVSKGDANQFMGKSGTKPDKFKRDLLENSRGSLCVLSFP